LVDARYSLTTLGSTAYCNAFVNGGGVAGSWRSSELLGGRAL